MGCINCRKANRAAVVCIEGNIGAGKTTLIKNLQTQFPEKIKIIEEPVNTIWKTGIENLYKDYDTYFPVFQRMVQEWFNDTIPKLILKYSKQYKCICVERSCYTGKEVFGRAALLKQTINENEFHDLFIKKYQWTPDLFICMKISDKICYKRIFQRGRNCEIKNITMPYLAMLNDLHMNLYLKLQVNNDIVIINANDNEKQILNDVIKIFQKKNII